MTDSPITDGIRKKLKDIFAPLLLEIRNDSALHHGHAGTNESGESHLRIHMIAEIFSGMSAVNRQRRVYQILSEELQGSVHALSLNLKSPEEEKTCPQKTLKKKKPKKLDAN